MECLSTWQKELWEDLPSSRLRQSRQNKGYSFTAFRVVMRKQARRVGRRRTSRIRPPSPCFGGPSISELAGLWA